VIQIGAIAAVLVYFWTDIWRIARAWATGLVRPELRGRLDHRMGWYIIVGSIPIGVVGLLARDLITGPLRSLWVVATALILWSAVMLYAERRGSQRRGEKDLTLRAVLVIGLVQCVALVPGVSRSAATISSGLLFGLDRVTATKLSFYLSIPALVAAGLFQLPDALSGDIGIGQTLVGTAVSFVVAYAAVAWLLRFVAGNSIAKFVPYRVGLGLVLMVALSAGWVTAT
jgi:undecaprenyl-diphosphatase